MFMAVGTSYDDDWTHFRLPPRVREQFATHTCVPPDFTAPNDVIASKQDQFLSLYPAMSEIEALS
jgi:hypothetical protein